MCIVAKNCSRNGAGGRCRPSIAVLPPGLRRAFYRRVGCRARHRAVHLDRPRDACRKAVAVAADPFGLNRRKREMRFTRLQMTDFRATRELDIGFERDVTVIVGRNGVGKTSILDALCITISFLRDELNKARPPAEGRPARGVPYSRTDFREGTAGFDIELTFDMSDEPQESRLNSTLVDFNVNVEFPTESFVPMIGVSCDLSNERKNADASRPRFVYFRQERGFAAADAIGSRKESAILLNPEAVQDSSLEGDLRAITDLEAWWDRHDARRPAGCGTVIKSIATRNFRRYAGW